MSEQDRIEKAEIQFKMMELWKEHPAPKPVVIMLIDLLHQAPNAYKFWHSIVDFKDDLSVELANYIFHNIMEVSLDNV